MDGPPDTSNTVLRPATTEEPPTPRMHCELEEIIPGHPISVFTCNDKKYFVGVQLANLLKRETFNLYRSLKIKNVLVSRAKQEHTAFLIKAGAVRGGTHSVTLIDYDSCLAFLRRT